MAPTRVGANPAAPTVVCTICDPEAPSCAANCPSADVSGPAKVYGMGASRGTSMCWADHTTHCDPARPPGGRDLLATSTASLHAAFATMLRQRPQTQRDKVAIRSFHTLERD
ncbi:hypothetical protein [Paenarthrobacter sp. YIM B13468]|uniref:hypothetical protein n=1 Tax=Paenarthrobacter sp. YIM B13468 TaxID=3366295 RepID=UPI00366FD473